MATKKKAPAKVEQVQETAPAPVITSIKGFSGDLSCRGFQFEIGKTYDVPGKIKACGNGFHACPEEHHPLSVFEFYPPAGSRFCIVEQSGETNARDTKLASAKITIVVEISLGDLAQRAVKWVFDRANWIGGAVATKDGEGATASGTRGAATASGYHSVACALGYEGNAKACASGAIVLVARKAPWDGGDILHILAAKVGDTIGGVTIKPDTWYRLAEDGAVEEVTS